MQRISLPHAAHVAPARAARLGEEDGRLLLRVVLPRHLLQLVQQMASAQPLLRLSLPEVSICQYQKSCTLVALEDSNPRLLVAHVQVGSKYVYDKRADLHYHKNAMPQRTELDSAAASFS